MDGITKFWVYVGIIVWFLIWVRWVYKGRKESFSFETQFWVLIGSIIVSGVTTMLIIIISFAAATLICKQEYKLDWNTYITSTQDSNCTYLSRTSSKQGFRYNYFIQTSQGKQPKFLEDYTGSSIYLRDELDKDHVSDARIETWSKHFTNPIVEKIFQKPDYAGRDIYWVFYIPKGSIQDDFNIDLK